MLKITLKRVERSGSVCNVRLGIKGLLVRASLLAESQSVRLRMERLLV